MRYWIDGYNLLFRVSQSYHAIKENQPQVFLAIHQWASSKSLDVTIVMDGHHKNEAEGSTSSFYDLKIIYTPLNQSADDYICLEIQSSYDASKETVISTDLELLRRIKIEGGKTLTVESFLKRLQKKPALQKKSEEKRLSSYLEDPFLFENLKRRFEESLSQSIRLKKGKTEKKKGR